MIECHSKVQKSDGYLKIVWLDNVSEVLFCIVELDILNHLFVKFNRVS